ncbi:MAG TPA: alpha/beta hydrolase [Thermomicrobiales bacterium]|nr:alpha/beta hydrolase [Thermomicrobiales bacterium]
MRPIFVLIHSPLVGPATWEPVRIELRRRGVQAAVPALRDEVAGGVPYWQQAVASVMVSLRGAPAGQPLVLVGHSGAGALLPALGEALGRPVAACVFVDAGIHRDGLSRLEMMDAEDAPFARQLRAHLESGGRYPEWTDAQLQEAIPDDERRAAVLADIRPRGLDFFSEPIPVPAGWPDGPCRYLQLSSAYDVPARQARRLGWPVREIEGGHFLMLIDPETLAEAILALAETS